MIEEQSKQFMVKNEDTALHLGSGDLLVLATPRLVAMLENTAKEIPLERLSDDETTVGIEMNLKHVKATAVGKEVTCFVKLTEIKKSILFFDVKAVVDEEMIATGTHIRAIVSRQSFMEKI
ncbi:thioesterase family protein [Carnobacterium divergens]|uniref:thioesterase family protein n=1 Tax=Carnobacterium divergens TaxID=2748 RepID=UPI0039B0CA31